MPDAARLIAALCIGAIAYGASLQVMNLMPDSTDFGAFLYVNTILGVVTGWTVMGKRAGRGVTAAVNNGLSGAFMLVLWGLFIHACYRMFDRAMANWYNGIMDAIAAIFQFMAEFALVMIDPLLLFTLVTGGILAGLLTECAWRIWR